MSILPVGFVKWDGTKYIIVGDIDLSGPAGPPGPQGPAGIAVGPASGDLGGNFPNPLVVKLQGRSVASTAPTNGQLLTWVAGNNDWEPVSAPSGFSAGGDLSGSSTSQNVINIHGASVPIAGGLTTGNVLQVTGASALSYGAVNLAGGANFVTGTLPSGNQASQTMSGDVTGTTAANTVVKLTGTAAAISFPIGNKITSTGVSNVGDIITTGVGVLSFGNLASATTTQVLATTAVYLKGTGGNVQASAPDIYLDSDNGTHLRTVAGTEGFKFVASGPYMQLDSASGTFPSTGLIRVKNYVSETAIISFNHAGGNSKAFSLDGTNQRIVIGNENVTVGTALQLNSYYGILIQTIAIPLTVVAPATTGSVIWQTPANIQNILFDLAAAAGNCNLRFANSIIPTIKQDTAASDTATFDFTISPQAPFTTATSGNRKPGSLIVNLSAPTNSGTAEGSFKVSRSGTSIAAIKALDATPTYSGLYFQGNEATASSYSILGNSSDTYLGATSAIHFSISDSERMLMTTNVFRMGNSPSTPEYIFDLSTAAIQHFGVSATSATIKYDDLTTNGGTGNPFTIQGQNETGTTSIGGDLVLVAGTGTSTNGNIKANSPIQLDAASGTFPVAGLIRTKQETTLLWGGRNSAGDANIINQSNAALTFGDANATSGWTTNLFGYNTTIQCRTTLDVYVAAGANLGFYEFGGNKNITWTFAAASGAASMAWTDNIIPTIKQLQATSGNGATFTIAAQDGFGTGVTNGGTIKIFGGTPHSSGTSGGVWISSDSSLTHSSIYVTDSSVDIGNAGTGNIYIDTPLLHFRTAAGVSIIDSQLATSGSYLEWTAAMVGDVTIDIAQNTAQNNGVNLILGAQPAKLSGSGNGGNLLLRGGARDGTGLKGGVKIQLNSTTETMFEAVAVLDGYRITALNRGANLTSTQMPFDSGDLVTYIGNANIVPHVNPVSGVILYSDSGVLKVRQPDGTTVTIASSGGGTLSGDVTGTTSATVVSAISGSSPIAITPATLQWINTAASPTITQADRVASGNATNLIFRAQNATSTGNGGKLVLSSGANSGGTDGYIDFQIAGIVDAKSKMVLNTDGGLLLKKTGFITSTAGDLNFGNGATVYFRGTGSQDLPAFTFNASNQISIGYGNGFSSPGDLVLESDATKSVKIKTTPTFQFSNNISSPTIKIEDATNGSGSDLTVAAQKAVNGGNPNGSGGYVNIMGGAKVGAGGTGIQGGVRLQLDGVSSETSSDGGTMFEIAEVVTGGHRFTAINRGSNMTATQMPANTGDKVTFIGNAATAPTASAVSGGILYSESGALKWRGSSGTTTTMGPAEPHCPVCGSDFVTEHQSEVYGYLSVCLKCLSDHLGTQPWIQRSK